MIFYDHKKFLILCFARTGSTNMMNILKSHPDIGGKNVRYEPFCRNAPISMNHFKKRFHALNSIQGFKIHFDQITREMIRYACKSKRKIIFMDRRNLLQSAVSHDRAWETNIWSPENAGKNWSGYDDFPVSNVSRIGRLIKNNSFIQKMVLSFLKNNNIDFHYIVYEDFYLTYEENKVEQLKQVFEYLGHKPIVTKPMLNILRRKKMNDERSYLRIPNVYEIERKFGSNKNGWLLNGGLQL